jgi:hypothetical protein
MGIGRTILAALISLSVTMLPAAGGAAFKSTPRSTPMSTPQDAMGSHQDPSPQDAMGSQDAMDMSAAGPMDDCCPHPAGPCDKAMGGCTSMATCALKCFSFAGSVSSPLIYPRALANVLPLFESGIFRSQTSVPPFRPPRI